ncbi:MAG TPA: hypothetical protein VK498_05845 [Ferruginibacter sp.]|nr:hypothetical protein [Ferruginibacter sp.]
MRLIISLLLLSSFCSCRNDKNIPDVSKINPVLSTRRFEKELFSIDTNKLSPQLDRLLARFPSFGENFLTTILNTDPKWPADSAAAYVNGFISTYRNVYDTAQLIFDDFSPYEKQIKESLRFVKYYFPEYKIPRTIITYIGPLDGFGDILDEDAFIIGLQHHLGKKFSGYQTAWLQETYPLYISNRFEPGTIVINCMKNIVNDMYPEKNEDKSLLIQMVEKGKRLYMLHKLIPDAEEYSLIGYSPLQLKESYQHEAIIWDMFIQNNLLQSIDNNVIKNYIGESPKTQELGEASPGNIGSFAGWQIVKKYMDKKTGTSLHELMGTDPEIIFQEAKYKP